MFSLRYYTKPKRNFFLGHPIYCSICCACVLKLNNQINATSKPTFFQLFETNKTIFNPAHPYSIALECHTIGMSGWTTGQMVARAREGSDAKIISTFANTRHVHVLLQ